MTFGNTNHCSRSQPVPGCALGELHNKLRLRFLLHTSVLGSLFSSLGIRGAGNCWRTTTAPKFINFLFSFQESLRGSPAFRTKGTDENTMVAEL